MRFANKVALITGAGSGIGAATARLMAAEGAAIGVMGRTAATVERTARQVLEAKGRAIPITGDVSKEADAGRAVAETVKAFGRLDIVVSNAGIQLHKRDKPIHEQELAAWEETQDVNLRGAFLVCRAGIKQMLAQGGGGSVVITGSIVALVGSAFHNPAPICFDWPSPGHTTHSPSQARLPSNLAGACAHDLVRRCPTH